jgi:hypothetical protein
MFTGIRRGRAASAAVLMLGVFVALTIIAPAALGGPIGKAATQPASTQSRSVSCDAFDFQPVDSDTGADYFNAKRIRKGTGGSGFFICNPSLPNTAVVTKVQFSVWDGSGSSQVKFCGLYRSGLTASTADTVQELASLPATGISTAPGFIRLTDSSIQNATVNNAKYVFWLQCNLEQAGQSLGLFGANVIYSITSANG